jgi:hypothetical protein
MEEITMHRPRLRCPCGDLLVGADADDLVEKAQHHLSDQHPHMADRYNRDDILFMAF